MNTEQNFHTCIFSLDSNSPRRAPGEIWGSAFWKRGVMPAAGCRGQRWNERHRVSICGAVIYSRTNRQGTATLLEKRRSESKLHLKCLTNSSSPSEGAKQPWQGRAVPSSTPNTWDASWWTDSFTAGTPDWTLICPSYRRLFTWKTQRHSGSNLMNRCKSTLCPFLSSFTLKCKCHIRSSLLVAGYFPFSFFVSFFSFTS